MMNEKKKRELVMLGADLAGCVVAFVVFVIPFLFMLFTSLKDRKTANSLSFSIPEVFCWENFLEVLQYRDFQLLTAFKNSILITVGGCLLLILISSMAGFVIQRRSCRVTRGTYALLMIGLMVPYSILPTIWVLKGVGLYKTMISMILIETCMQLPFATMLYRSFCSTIPRELDEAALIDGITPFAMYRRIILPLLKPVHASVVICSAVAMYNDFMTPLYFFSGADNVTVQMTLYNYLGLYSNDYHLLFANVILAVLPLFILFLIFNKKIVDGMVFGAVKG